jgi:hypothetical protein
MTHEKACRYSSVRNDGTNHHPIRVEKREGCTFSFGHCVVCSSSIYRFWLPLWYLQTLLAYENPSQPNNYHPSLFSTRIGWWFVPSFRTELYLQAFSWVILLKIPKG